MIKVGTITKKQILNINRAVGRELEIEAQTRVSYNRVFKSKKAYNRQSAKKVKFDN